MEGLFELKAKYNDAKLIVGNTEVGIEMKFKSMAYPHLVGVTHIAELNRIEVRILDPSFNMIFARCEAKGQSQIHRISCGLQHYIDKSFISASQDRETARRGSRDKRSVLAVVSCCVSQKPEGCFVIGF